MFPRYFVPRKAEPDPAPPARGPLLLQVIDVFRLGGRGRSQREVAVVVDRTGALHLLDPTELPPSLVAGLHHHELTTGGKTRLLDVEELWLLSIQVLEQPGDAPGLNDPVYLYGRLYGPLPGAQPVMADGQLALTRADLLDGLTRARPDGFTLGTTPSSRVLHALLPADRAELVEQGRATVLAYPLLPAELLAGDVGNELLAAGLVYDLLVATQADATRSRASHPLVGMTLPVPSRDELERDLDAQGWDIKGDQAIRRSEVTKKGTLGSVFSQVFGVSDAMRLSLPPEASVDELLALAERILPAFTDFPDRRANAVRARTVRGVVRPEPVIARREPTVPRPSSPAPQPAPPAPARDDWMKDFVKSHGDKPRITRVGSQAPQKKSTPSKKPDWMKDFGDE